MNTKDDIRGIVFNDLFTKKGDERIAFLLRYAVLAPSTHNSQPWLFSITEDSCELFRDPSLKIPYADPDGRDMYISLGCAIENLVLASEAYGVKVSVSYGPFSDEEHVAHIGFDFSGLKTHLNDTTTLEAILRRINARGVFKDDKVSGEFVDTLKTRVYPEYKEGNVTVHFLDDKKDITCLADIAAEAMTEIYHNASFRKEMSGWMNNSLTRKKKGIPGWSLKIPLFVSFFVSTVIRNFDVGSKLAALNRKSIASAPLALVMTAPTNDKLSWLHVGRIAERTMIECFRDRYHPSIYVASIEIGEYYKKVQDLIKTSDRPQFIVTIGVIDSLHKPTPRYAVHDKIKRI